MKKSIFRAFYAFIIATFSFSSCANNKATETKNESKAFQSVSVKEFAKCIADTANVVLVDVRTAEEFNAGHIEGATNIDVKRDDFESISNAELPKDKTLAIYCRSGRRSKTAGEILTKNGFKVIELESGYNGWTKQ